MRNIITLILLVAALATSCTSRSERLAKYKNKVETKVVLKIPLDKVIEYDNMNQLVQYYESDTTLVSLIGAMYAVQDSIFVTKYAVFKRNKINN